MDIQRAKPDSVVDISEKGRSQDGSVISLNRRLYMQFLAFGAAQDAAHYASVLAGAGVQGVLYQDLNDPNGLGLLTFGENPEDFLVRVRPLLKTQPFSGLQLKP